MNKYNISTYLIDKAINVSNPLKFNNHKVTLFKNIYTLL